MYQPPVENALNLRNNRASLRLLIADDQPRVRQSLEALLMALRWNASNRTEVPIEIVGAADSGQQAMEQVRSLCPDVVVMDLPTHNSAHQVASSGPQLDGPATIRTIKSRRPAVRVIVPTMYSTDRSAFLLAGADVFLLKGCPTSELPAAVMTETRELVDEYGYGYSEAAELLRLPLGTVKPHLSCACSTLRERMVTLGCVASTHQVAKVIFSSEERACDSSP